MAEQPSKIVMTLDSGDVHIQLRPDLAPKHVERITELAKQSRIRRRPSSLVVVNMNEVVKEVVDSLGDPSLKGAP